MNEMVEKLLSKSKEAFVLSIEIYNRPTIKYRVEGFAFFICNAWELMLKAHMISKFGPDSIYYSDKRERTLSIGDCVKRVFTNSKDPLRENLEKIIELRNTSTHFITEEYEMVYIPLFQACVLNFTNKMLEFHDIDMTEVVPQNFLTLSASMKMLSDSEFIAKYPEAIANKYLSLKESVSDLSDVTNEKYAININVRHFITKNRKEADAVYHIAKDGELPIAVLKQLQDPNSIFRFKAKSIISVIRARLKKDHVVLLQNGAPVDFNMYHFNCFVSHYGVKENKKLCWKYQISTQPLYSYSQQAVDFIYDELRKDPEHILDKIKKITPGAKEF